MFMRVVPALCLVLSSGFSVSWGGGGLQLVACYRPAGPGQLQDKGKDEYDRKLGNLGRVWGKGGQERASW